MPGCARKMLAAMAVLVMSCGPETTRDTNADMDTEAGQPEVDLPTIHYRFHTVLPIPDEGSLADPHVIKLGDTWYLYATHSQEGFEVWTSQDLENWEEGSTIWEPTLGWQVRGGLCGMWAPHVEPAGDLFYLYYSANCRIGVAVADSPLGPFLEVSPHPLVGNGHGGIGDGVLVDDLLYDWSNFAIDAFLLQQQGGQKFLYFTAMSPLSEIHVVPMADFVTVAGPPTRVLEADVHSWEGIIREGAWVMERDDQFMLMYSGNQSESVDYGIGVATAPSPLGPFVRDSRNPLLRADPANGFFGPGHHSVVPGAHDDLLFFYHTKVSAERDHDRRLRYGLLWFAEDGRVFMGGPDGRTGHY